MAQHHHHPHAPAAAADACCAAPPLSAPDPTRVEPGEAPNTFRIATMDCTVEESEIRRLVEPIAGIRGLHFRLGQRTLRIDGTDAAVPLALAAIRKAGFVPEPLDVAAQTAPSPDGALHAHGASPGHLRLAAALALAAAAEAISFLAPDILAWKAAGMAVAAAAIWLAGLETYAKGLSALRHGKLNINALMSVAVTGAFVIGQWPEAAMVMALYAIAELIEARAVDRARNAIAGPDRSRARRRRGGAARRQLAPRAGDRDRPRRDRPRQARRARGARRRGHARPAAPSTRRPSPARAFRPTRSRAARSSPARSTRTASLEFRVTATASDSTLARIIHAVEEAQGTRAPTAALRRPLRRGLHARGASRSRWRWRCCRRCCWAGPGWTRSTRRWCCW